MTSLRPAVLLLGLVALVALLGCPAPPEEETTIEPPPAEEPPPPEDEEPPAEPTGEEVAEPSAGEESAQEDAEGMITTDSGLQYQDITVGAGDEAEAGDPVIVHYTGWLEDGTKFDSSHDRGRPFDFRLGQREVIPGWDEGVQGMKEGGKRRLIIPSDLAYGPQGFPPVIPPNAKLTFVVELLEVE